MSAQRNTRQVILSEAFLLCEESSKSMFSLSDVAQRVGISKTAIFRHFKNKDALLQEMATVFLDDFAVLFYGKNYFSSSSTLLTKSKLDFSKFIRELIHFFLNNKGYLGFMLSSKILMPSPGQFLLKGLSERGVIFSDEFMQAKSLERFFRIYFCGESLIYFLSRRNCLLSVGVKEYESDEEFINTIIELLWSGIGSSKLQLESSRRQEFDRICEVHLEDVSEETRFFKAFAETFKEVGFDGLTVERFSEKLNLAKSSLYSFYENKDEFITKMLIEELSMIIKTVVEKAKVVNSTDELAYVVLKTEKNYLEKRPCVLTIHYWAAQKGYNIYRKENNDHKFEQTDFSCLEEKNLIFNCGLNLQSFVGWGSSLIGVLKTLFEMTNLKVLKDKCDYANELYKLLVNGICDK